MQVEFDHHDCLFMQSWDLCALWTVLCGIRSSLPGAMASGPVWTIAFWTAVVCLDFVQLGNLCQAFGGTCISGVFRALLGA